ncbi:FHA domain-containing protein [Streptomyces sp. NBC_00878]|uniref:FHA domain-containing protein n=1 Tax=Streptomyces sp. NBC_00878 TaxID=2975854 RepID=UPI0022538BAF|nr:FHA domain-containing protein [Streptomyces sp. NBC_00878]MCX4908267.1 FHA domain-containing protein [Streptomyces sp. NBC_00878]
MQIRLTVVDPLGTRPEGRPASCDVLVTAPAGTALAAVASGLASAVGGEGAGVLFAGAERLDAQRCTLGEPPLMDGAVLSLGAPAEPGPELDPAAAQLRVVAGPDAGGVHFLHGGRIDIGRSADADVPLDDPDVSRLHCAVTVAADGHVSVADLGSTNGTTLDGRRVSERPVRLAPGSLLRVGESALRLTPAGEPDVVRETAPDGEGRVRVVTAPETPGRGAPPAPVGGAGQKQSAPGEAARVPHAREAGEEGDQSDGGAPEASRSRVAPPTGETHHGYGTAGWGAAEGGRSHGAQGHTPAGPAVVPGQGGAPRMESTDSGAPSGAVPEDSPDTSAPGESGRKGTPLRGTSAPREARKRGGLSAWARRLAGGRSDEPDAEDDDAYETYGAYETPAAEPVAAGAPEPERWPDHAALLLTALGPGPRLWERGPGHPETLTVRLGTADRSAPDGSGTLPSVPVTAGLREVGALGLAGPRGRLSGLARAVVAQLAALHSPDTLEITLISTDRSRSVEERTAEWSWLGWLPHLRPTHGQDCRLLLAYDREQATARTEELVRRLEDHLAEVGRASAAGGGAFRLGAGSPDDNGAFSPLNRSGAGERREPGTERGQGGGTNDRPGASPDDPTRARPRHASDDDPALAGERTDSRSRTTDQTSGPAPARAHPTARDSNTTHLGLPRSGTQTSDAAARGQARRPSWARSDDPARAGWQGPHTVVVVDGDPGSAGVREAVSRLAAEGPQAGIHVICLAETPSASPASPVTDTYEAACAASPAFRECGAVALLSGDVATALRLLRVAHGKPAGGGSATPQGGPVGHGTVAAVDAVSMAWAERFARALAPLRADGVAGDRHTRVSAPLPQAARLLDELGLARATPASLMARWADAADDTEALGGRATAVLGAGPRGPVCVNLSDEGPHLLVEGPSGSGRTELLRSVAASLAAAERPDRLGIVLIDGRDSTGGGAATRGDGLQVCTDLPHVTTHLGAHDPVRMREFAQSLSAELKRRAELLGRLDFAEWHAGQDRNDRQDRHDRHDRQGVSGRVVAQRSAGAGSAGSVGAAGTAGSAGGVAAGAGAGDLDASSTSTLRLRPAAARPRPEAGPPLPRLVVVVDDLDALLSPALGSPGRPAAGSVVRALEAVARDGERLGVHLVAATGGGARTDETELARRASLRVVLEAPTAGPEEPAPGRGRLGVSAGRSTPFQAGRVTGRIPRTATLRPTVVPLEWARMGDPPARRPVRELGNGPTDLALLASALERAARSVSATEVPSLL